MTAELGAGARVEHVTTSHVDVTPLQSPPALRDRLSPYVARVGLLAAAMNLGCSRQTLDRALGGLRVIRAIQRQMLDALDRDDRARATTNEGSGAGT